MRTVSCLALALAALTSVACGSAAPEASGNTFVTSNTLEVVELLPVTVDTEDPGCTVDGIRFGRCGMTRTEVTDIKGQRVDLCELHVDDGAHYAFECDLVGVDLKQELPWHCPGH